jgi:hypothetical protein
MNFPIHSRKVVWMFPIFFVVYGWWFGFFDIIQSPAGGMHFVRQTDVLGFVAHYQKSNASLFCPGTLSLDTADGKAVCEFPIIYYFAAQVCSDIPSALLWLRIFNFVLFGLSLFVALRVLEKWLGWWSWFLVGIVLSSGVCMYYGMNILPDSIALSLTWIGLALFFAAIQRQKWNRWNTIWLILIFTLASLLKITYSIYPIALFVSLILSRNIAAPMVPMRDLIGAAVSHVVIVGAWYGYAKWHAKEVGDIYFLLTYMPLWERPMSQWSEVLKWPWTYWQNIFLHVYLKLLIAAWTVIAMAKSWKQDPFIFYLLSSLILGKISFLVLFATHLRDHDYYLLVLLPGFLICASCGIALFKKSGKQRWWHALLAMGCLLVAMGYNQKKVISRLEMRTSPYTLVYDAILADESLCRFFNSQDQPLVLLIGDESHNGGLVALNCFGWCVKWVDWQSNHPMNAAKIEQANWIVTPRALWGESIINVKGFERVDFPQSNFFVLRKSNPTTL